MLVSPGPDLLYLTGYAPVAITERLTMLVIPTDGKPTTIVPALERPDAEAAPCISKLTLLDWMDGTDPYDVAAGVLRADRRYAVSDSAWAMHILGLQEHLPDSGYVSMTQALPMLRAVKDTHELARLSAAGERRPGRRVAVAVSRHDDHHDRHVGQLLDLLDELGIAEDTIVIYSTDNGPHMNSWPDGAMTPFRSEKDANWEGAFRIPEMVRWPGKIPSGVVSNEIIQHHDWLPTFLAAAGEPDIVDPEPGGRRSVLRGAGHPCLGGRCCLGL